MVQMMHAKNLFILMQEQILQSANLDEGFPSLSLLILVLSMENPYG